MKKLIQITLVALFIPLGFTFAQKKMSLVIYKAVHCNNKNALLFYYKITNEGDSNEIFYKPEADDFCNGLLYLNITEIKSHTIGFYFPCKSKEQLDNILLDSTNTFRLQPKHVYESFFCIQKKYLSIALKKGYQYALSMSINYNDLESDSAINFYNTKIVSNKTLFVW